MDTLFKFLYQSVEATLAQEKNIDNQYLELRGISNSGKIIREFLPIDQLESGVDAFVKRYNDSYNIYYGVATRNNQKSGKKKDCSYLTAIYIDIDADSPTRKGKTLFKSKEDIIAHLERLQLGESIVVDTGYGIQAYWLLNEPFKLNSGLDDLLEDLMKHLSIILGGDHTNDISRVFRVPKSMNIKDADNPKRCNVIKENYDQVYSLEDLIKRITDHPVYIKKLLEKRSSNLYEKLFGLCDEANYKSRSEFEQHVITSLLGKGFSEEEVKSIFNYFPVGGKYLDKLEENSTSALQYLDHSINSAITYLNNNTTNLSQEKSILLKDNNKNTQSRKSNIGIPLLDKEKYTVVNEGSQTGYYRYTTDKNGEIVAVRMTNFLVEFKDQIRSKIDGNTSSVLKGEIKFDDGTVEFFNNLEADALASSADLKKYLSSAFATKVKFISYANELAEAIKALGEQPKLTEAMHNGFNKSYDKYVTRDLIITPNEFIKEKTPILFDNSGHKNYLGFNRPKENKSLSQVMFDIKSNYLQWDSYKVTLYSLTAALLPIIYPFIREYCNGKPYLILQGPSGCGKSTMILLNQGFFGSFSDLTSFSSTPNSIETKGHAFKDALYCVDDMKLANIPDRDRKKIQLLFQNYADETGRNRLNVDLTLREQRFIQGIMMVSAEDLVLTETSTIARGIIVPLSEKRPNYALRNQLIKESQSYQIFTKHFIQNILRIADSFDFQGLFEKKQKELEELRGELELEGDNIPRMINNFSVFATTFHFVKYFLLGDEDKNKIREIDEHFLDATKELLQSNYRRIQNHKPEEKFENTLWEMVELDILKLLPIGKMLDYNTKRENVIGYYQILDNGDAKVAINIIQAYRKVNQFLMNDGGLGHSRDTIVQKLLMQKKIRIPSANGLSDSRVSFGSKGQQRGVEWLGHVPFKALGIDAREYCIVGGYRIPLAIPEDTELPLDI